MRLILFDRLGNELRDVSDVLSCHRHERLDGTDELNFETLDDVEKGQRLLLKDSIGNYHEYVIGSIDETHDGESAPIKAVWAESAMAHDFRLAYIEDKRPGVATPTSAYNAIKPITDAVGWQRGLYENTHNAGVMMYHVSAWQALSDFCEAFGVEPYATYLPQPNDDGSTSVMRLLNFAIHRGVSGNGVSRRFDWGSDIEGITRTVHEDDVVTAVWCWGKGEEIESDNGGTAYGRRIGISGVTADGLGYLHKDSLLDTWGIPTSSGMRHRFGEYIDEECDDPQKLMADGQAWLDEHCTPNVGYQATVLQYGVAGVDFTGVALGDDVHVVDRGFEPELRKIARVVEITTDEMDRDQTEVTLDSWCGDYASDSKALVKAVDSINRRAAAWDAVKDSAESVMQAHVDALNAMFASAGGYQTTDTATGTTWTDGPTFETSTMAINISGAGFRIANSKTSSGTWNWRTFGTGGGFNADEIVAGILSAIRIQSLTDPENNYWDLSTGVAKMLQLIAGKVGTSETSYAEIGTYSVVGHAVNSSITNTYTGHGIVLHEGADTTLKLLYDKNGKQLLLGVESGTTTSYLMRIGLDYNSADPNTVYFEVNTKHNGMVTNFLASDGGLDIQSWDGTTYKGNMIPIDTPYCPVYRLYNSNNGNHFWTVDVSEAQTMVRNGWTNEGIKFHAFK